MRADHRIQAMAGAQNMAAEFAFKYIAFMQCKQCGEIIKTVGYQKGREITGQVHRNPQLHA